MIDVDEGTPLETEVEERDCLELMCCRRLTSGKAETYSIINLTDVSTPLGLGLAVNCTNKASLAGVLHSSASATSRGPASIREFPCLQADEVAKAN